MLLSAPRFGEAAALRWGDVDPVFPNGNGKPLRANHVLVGFHKVLDRARLPRRRIHDLRHTYATRLFANRQHLRAVQELMGHCHSDITADIYTDSVPEVLGRLRERSTGYSSRPRERIATPAPAET